MPPAETYAESLFEAELIVPSALIRIMRLHLDQPTDRLFYRTDHYWLDLCLTPRPEKARLVPPGEAIHIRSETGGRQASVICEIPHAAIDCWLDDGGIDWTDRRLAAGLDITHPHMRACLLRLADEVRHPGSGSAILAELIARQLAIEVARYCQAIGEGPVSGGLSSWRLRRIEERLHMLGPPPTLGELAALCNLSPRQLTRGFRASRGCSIGDHIAQTRIDMAKRHLATPQSIKEIAFALGFASPSSFAYAFRRATGATPRQFRQRRLSPQSSG